MFEKQDDGSPPKGVIFLTQTQTENHYRIICTSVIRPKRKWATQKQRPFAMFSAQGIQDTVNCKISEKYKSKAEKIYV